MKKSNENGRKRPKDRRQITQLLQVFSWFITVFSRKTSRDHTLSRCYAPPRAACEPVNLRIRLVCPSFSPSCFYSFAFFQLYFVLLHFKYFLASLFRFRFLRRFVSSCLFLVWVWYMMLPHPFLLRLDQCVMCTWSVRTLISFFYFVWYTICFRYSAYIQDRVVRLFFYPDFIFHSEVIQDLWWSTALFCGDEFMCENNTWVANNIYDIRPLQPCRIPGFLLPM